MSAFRQFVGTADRLRSRLEDLAPIALRLIVGCGFIAHGFAKLTRGPDAFIGIMQALHVPMPEVFGWATILVELIGGFAVLVGAFVPLISVPMAAVLIAAALTVHPPYGFSAIKLEAVTSTGAQFGRPGYEVDLLYLACLSALVLVGAGPFSVDRALWAKVRTTSSTHPAPKAVEG